MAAATNSGLKTIGVKNVKTSDLLQNPHNPRMLFDRLDMESLKASIQRSGILVPLTVYKEKASGKYRILDGQRRWMCAQEIGMTSLPVNEVAEPSLVQNIVTMFQIHKLRRDWELMPTALKLRVLMEETNDTADSRLAALTGLDVAVVVRCKKLLSFPKRYQDMMLDIEPKNRVKADFFIELHPVVTDRFVKKFDWFKRNPFTDQMLEKHKKGALKSVTEFRAVKQHIANAVKANRIGLMSKRLETFAETVDLPVDSLAMENVKIATQARAIAKDATELRQAVAEIDVEQYYGEGHMWDTLSSLADTIREKLKKSGRRVD
jgi:ParB family chromosome partitioning protein